MPELPEVETVRAGLQPYLEGAVIQAVIVREPRLRYFIDAEVLKAQLTGQRVLGVRRRAKYVLLEFTEGTLLIHLGMTGVLRVLPLETPVEKHDHIDFLLIDALIRYKDVRRFGAMLWLDDRTTHPLLTRLGEEPLSPEFNAETLAKKLVRTSRAIKLALMDQQIVVGVGNIYANEALFEAKIHPQTAANKVTQAKIEALVSAIKRILKAAIAQGGTTLKDFLTIEGKPGYFHQTLKVYGRKGAPCTGCNAPIVKIILGQRATYFCPSCQDNTL
jgi:formamidopyrimidine-DNA glycosylase